MVNGEIPRIQGIRGRTTGSSGASRGYKRERLGKKIFDYEKAKPDFNPKHLSQSGAPPMLSQLPTNVLFPAETIQLVQADINRYGISWEDYWWGRTYWFYFFYRNGDVFSYDVFTKMKKNAVIDDRHR